jgi:methylglutaconyl-CoA hydratase
MSNNSEAFVKSEHSDGLQTIEFFHPSHNSLPGSILKKLKDAILEAGKDDRVKLILLKSDGPRTFCAGASFDELIAIEDEVRGKEFFMGFANVINAIRTCGKVVIGRVQGKAVGGGVGIASAVDYCVATKYASFRLSELAVGIGPFVIGPAVTRKIGISQFAHMSITPNQWQTAEWGLENNLYHRVFESTHELDDYLEIFIRELLTMNPQALNELKSVFWEGTENWDVLLEKRAEQSGKLVLSEFSKKSISKFLNK